MRKQLISGVIVVAAALATFTPAIRTLSAHAATNTTVVLTFDDDRSDQTTARDLLAGHGMVGTFYIDSNTVGSAGHMNWTQIQGLEDNGNEIGGHTLDFPHEHLKQVPTTEAIRQVCDDRDVIQSHGFDATNFAYPYGEGWDDQTIRGIVEDCGYSSARRASGLDSNGPYADTSPPSDIWGVKTEDLPVAATSLATLEGWVTDAENHGGGVVTIVFHEAVTSMPAFLDWLQLRAANGTVVKTMAQALGQVPPTDNTAPSSSIACNAGACSSGSYYTPSMHVSLSATDNAGGSGVAGIYYTTDGTTPSKSGTKYTSSFTLSSSKTIKYRAYDNDGNAESTHTQSIKIDGTAPTSTIKCNAAACTSAWHGAGEQLSLSATDSGSGVASIRYTTDGSTPSQSSTAYSAPFTLSSSKTVKFRAYDGVGNAESTHTQSVDVDAVAPDTTIKCKGKACSTGWYGSAVPVAIFATDVGSGVAAIHFTTDGSTPTLASPIYSKPFTLHASKTVRYRAVDNVGNLGTVKSKAVRIDPGDPKIVIASPGNGASVHGTVKVKVHVSDALSGVVKVNFKIDGKFASGDTKPAFAFSWNTATAAKGKHTVTATAFDAAGHATAASIKVNVR